MAYGKLYEQWKQTSSIMACLCNLFSDRKRTGAYKPEMFNPFHDIEQLTREEALRMIVSHTGEGQQ